MSFHAFIEHPPYDRGGPRCTRSQSWIRQVPWPPWEAHHLVGETDVDTKNYNLLQKKNLPKERYKSSAVGGRWRNDLALSGSGRNSTPDWGNSTGKCMEFWKERWSRRHNEIKWGMGCEHEQKKNHWVPALKPSHGHCCFTLLFVG